MSVLEDLRGRRADVWGKLEVILDESAAEGMTRDQATRHAELESEYARLDTDIKARERAEAAKADLADPRPVPAGIGHRSTPAVDHLAADERAYTQAWNRYMRSGIRGLNSADRDLLETRAQSLGVPSEGGYLVPTEFRQKLVERMKRFGGLANAVETITTATGNPIEWPTIDDTANSGEIVPENTQAAGGADLVFGSASLGAYKYMATGPSGEPFRVSVELLQDSAFDIESMIAKFAGKRIARKQSVDWVRGTGVGEPLGIVTGKTGVQIAANTGVTWTDIVNYVHAVDPDYRDQAKWAMNDASLGYFEGQVDDLGRPLLTGSMSGLSDPLGGPRLAGFPVVVDQAFANMSLASGTVNWGVFGDLEEAYVIRRVKDLQMIADPYTRAKFGQVEFTFWERADGTVQNPNAYVALTGKA